MIPVRAEQRQSVGVVSALFSAWGRHSTAGCEARPVFEALLGVSVVTLLPVFLFILFISIFIILTVRLFVKTDCCLNREVPQQSLPIAVQVIKGPGFGPEKPDWEEEMKVSHMAQTWREHKVLNQQQQSGYWPDWVLEGLRLSIWWAAARRWGSRARLRRDKKRTWVHINILHIHHNIHLHNVSHNVKLKDWSHSVV